MKFDIKSNAKPKQNSIDPAKETNQQLNRDCPIGVSRITSHLYICGAHALPGAVKDLKPGLVINAAPELPSPPEDIIQRFYVPLLDTPAADMHLYFDTVADLIHKVVSNDEIVLVHCVAGVSRSVTLCLSYLIKWQKMTLYDAYRHMKLRRPQVRPNAGFFKQLIQFEEKLLKKSSIMMIYCEVIDEKIPDIYERDYKGTTSKRQTYGPIEKKNV